MYVATLVWDNVSLNRKSTSRRLHLPSRKKHLTSATTQGGFSTVGNIAAHSDFEDSPRLEASFDRWSIMRRRCFSPTGTFFHVSSSIPLLFFSTLPVFIEIFFPLSLSLNLLFLVYYIFYSFIVSVFLKIFFSFLFVQKTSLRP